MAEIPQELITEILLISPVKSILRFRCVSKSLCAMIDGLDFVNSHLTTSSQTMNHRKLIFQDRSSRFHVCDMNDGVEEEIQLKPLPSSRDEVYGYCNGLLLLCRALFKLALWNPSTRQYSKLPDFPFRSVVFDRILVSGLGYDCIDGYKAVVMVYTQCGFEVWKFGVRSNTWRRIQDVNYAQYYKFCSYISQPLIGMFADGALYWLPLKFFDKNSQKDILAFDLTSESFSLIPLPVCSIPSSHRVITDLHVLEDCVCISFFCYTQADLYIRRKDGVGEFSWTQLYSIKELVFLNTFRFQSVKVLGYSKSRDNILLDFSMEELVSYDLEKKSFGKVELKNNPLWDHPILCIETLVSLGGLMTLLYLMLL